MISPSALAIILALGTPHGRLNGPLFALGWILGLAPLAVHLFMGQHAQRVLGHWRNRAAEHNAAVMAVLCFVLGLKLLGDGIGILAS
ncbi:hypothetical protein GCM10010341_61070 [Streptomyces noursei]|nr:hypothetical protein GCM10010341_61070 [Streptomyces noursei]